MDSNFNDLFTHEQNYKKQLFTLADKTEHILHLLVVTTTSKDVENMPSTAEKEYYHSKLPESLDVCGSLLLLLQNKEDLSLYELHNLLVEANYVVQEQMKISGSQIAQVLDIAQGIVDLPSHQERKQNLSDIAFAETQEFNELPLRGQNRCKKYGIVTLEDFLALHNTHSKDKDQHYLGGHPIGLMTLSRLESSIENALKKIRPIPYGKKL